MEQYDKVGKSVNYIIIIYSLDKYIIYNADYARNFSQCDSFLIGASSQACTYPYLDIWNSNSIVEHEAKISKVSEEQLFYLMQRGINIEQAISLLISGFCKEVFTMLPMEFATEADKLLSLKLEGTVG